MTPDNWAALIGIFLSILTAAVAAWQSKQAKTTGQVNQAKIAEVHVLVNDRLTKWVDRALQLDSALKSAGVTVPAPPLENVTEIHGGTVPGHPAV
jgi:hypothetical protein